MFRFPKIRPWKTPKSTPLCGWSGEFYVLLDFCYSLRYAHLVRKLIQERRTAMKSTITSKFQTTIPRIIRQNLALSVNDTLEWTFDHGKVLVSPLQKNFLKYQNSVKVGKGNIAADIELARDLRLEEYR